LLLASLVDPLLVFEMIHRIIDILVDYLGDVSEPSIRDNFVIVYQVSCKVTDDLTELA
jgi:AP-3 complex subunit mu